MARQRNPSTGYVSGRGFSPSSAGIGQQIMYTPEWADIDFADFQGLDMNLVNQNAQFAQEVANKRLDEVLKKRDALLESVKLHKRYDELQGQLDNKMSSIIDNMGNLQLSDSANYTALNSRLIKAKNDPVLQGAIESSEQAKAYEKFKFEKPEIEDQPWNDRNKVNYKRFLNGETNDFSFMPIYKEYDVETKADEFAKTVPADVQAAIVKYGVSGYSLQEKAVSDKSVGRILEAFKPLKQRLMQDPEFISWYKRRGDYEKTRGGSIDDVINDIFKSAAAKYGTTTPTVKLGMPQADPGINVGINLSENERAQARFDAEQAAGFPSVTGKGTAEKEPETYIDFSTGKARVKGEKLTEGQATTLVNNFLSKIASNPQINPFYEKGKTGGTYIKAKPDAEFDPAFKPTGNVETTNTGLVFEYGNGAGGIKYRVVPKKWFEQTTGVPVVSLVSGSSTTPTGTVPSYLETK